MGMNLTATTVVHINHVGVVIQITLLLFAHIITRGVVDRTTIPVPCLRLQEQRVAFYLAPQEAIEQHYSNPYTLSFQHDIIRRKLEEVESTRKTKSLYLLTAIGRVA